MRYLAICLVGTPLMLLLPTFAFAQTTPGQPLEIVEHADPRLEEIRVMKAQMADLTARLEAMEADVRPASVLPLGVAVGPVPPKGPARMHAEALQHASPATVDDGNHRFEVYGFVMIDGIHDFNRVDPLWEDTLRPSKIPTEDGMFGADGQTMFSVKQTRFGTVASGLLGDKPYEAKFEFNLFGSGSDAGQTTFRLRHAYGKWGPVLAGQTWTLFMDNDLFPNVVDFWGPNGMTWTRNPQFRFTFADSTDFRAAIALEKPSDDIDPGQIRQIDPELGANLKPSETFPDVTGQVRWMGDWGHVQLAAVVRKIGFETVNTPDNEPRGDEIGWGLNLGSHFKVANITLRLGAVYGEGIGSYMNDGGTDLAPEFIAPMNADAVPLPILGITAYADVAWSDTLTSAVGYSFMEIDNSNFQNDSAFHRGEYASINLLWRPHIRILTGPELLWARRTDKDGASGTDLRLQYSLKFSFTSNDLLKPR